MMFFFYWWFVGEIILFFNKSYDLDYDIINYIGFTYDTCILSRRIVSMYNKSIVYHDVECVELSNFPHRYYFLHFLWFLFIIFLR